MSEQIPPPPDPPGGQDTDPPDVRLAVAAAIALLTDIRTRGGLEDDLALRLAAVRSVLIRLRDLDHDGGRVPWWRTLGKRR